MAFDLGKMLDVMSHLNKSKADRIIITLPFNYSDGNVQRTQLTQVRLMQGDMPLYVDLKEVNGTGVTVQELLIPLRDLAFHKEIKCTAGEVKGNGFLRDFVLSVPAVQIGPYATNSYKLYFKAETVSEPAQLAISNDICTELLETTPEQVEQVLCGKTKGFSDMIIDDSDLNCAKPSQRSATQDTFISSILASR